MAEAGDRSGMSRVERRLAWALGLVAVFMVVEAVGGLLTGSLALLADAGHMLTDAAALSLALAGFWFGRRPPDPRRSYGYRRFEVLAAWVNGIALTGVALWIMVEAALRIAEPIPVRAGPMLGIAVVGLFVNLLTLRLLKLDGEEHINLRGAMLHVISDMLGSVAAISAAVVILLTGWTQIDPLLSLLVALLILRSAWALVKAATHILLEGTPEELDLERMRDELVRLVPHVRDVHHIHAWSLTSGRPLVTLHASVEAGADREGALRAIKAYLNDVFRVSHSVVQIETGRCPDASERPGAASRASAALALALCLTAAPAAATAAETAAEPGKVLVFAAASATDAVLEIADRFAAEGLGEVIASFAASATLARQIENGAPAELFISASEQWMDYLAERDGIEAASRQSFLGNRLVLIAPAESPLDLAIEPGFALADALGDGRLALGDPGFVPAGIYAKTALTTLGVWRSLESKLAPMADVRAVLAFVERGEAAAGIVYASDAAASGKVKVVGVFPDRAHPPVTYAVALVKGAGPVGRAFYDFLVSPPARAVFERHGFTVN